MGLIRSIDRVFPARGSKVITLKEVVLIMARSLNLKEKTRKITKSMSLQPKFAEVETTGLETALIGQAKIHKMLFLVLPVWRPVSLQTHLGSLL